jgi:mRNA interferase MazF
MAFQRGDVVLIPFPYTDLSATKTRPTVVVSVPEYQGTRGDLILAYLTSQTAPSDAEFDYPLVDWAAAGLLKPTLMRTRLAVVNERLVQYRVGALSARDMVEVDGRLRRALGL